VLSVISRDKTVPPIDRTQTVAERDPGLDPYCTQHEAPWNAVDCSLKRAECSLKRAECSLMKLDEYSLKRAECFLRCDGPRSDPRGLPFSEFLICATIICATMIPESHHVFPQYGVGRYGIFLLRPCDWLADAAYSY
jgi:hypothetical protein